MAPRGLCLAVVVFAAVAVGCNGSSDETPPGPGGSPGAGGSLGSGGALPDAAVDGSEGSGGADGADSGADGADGGTDAADSGAAGADGGTYEAGVAPSCVGGLTCNGESCCTTVDLPGGTFTQGGSPEVSAPAHPSTVSSFALDKYEVTVGRFRKFVNAYVDNTASAPAAGVGANPAIPNTGWLTAWNAELPATQAAFKDTAHLSCNATYQTWTDDGTGDESCAINCVSWYEAFAFCIWDGGRLATESEWEYAAAGGQENRLYPWGSAVPTTSLAVYGCASYPAGTCVVLPVSSTPAGNGRWGHADLAGNAYEWVLDYFTAYSASASSDYANVSTGFRRVARGGDFPDPESTLRSADRASGLPSSRGYGMGVRCARRAQ